MATKKISNLPATTTISDTDLIPVTEDYETYEPARMITQSELNRLVQQLHHLREALRPFANFAETLPEMAPPGAPPRLTDVGPAIAAKNPHNVLGEEHVITFADLRHAKMLLDQLEREDYKRLLDRSERQILNIPDQCSRLGCLHRIEGTQPWHCAGFCSRDCEARMAALRRGNYY